MVRFEAGCEWYHLLRKCHEVKLGLGPPELGDFHVMIEVKDLAQLDMAFDHVAERSEPTETFHFGVNSLVQNVRFALYRDFPDQQRQTGAERF